MQRRTGTNIRSERRKGEIAMIRISHLNKTYNKGRGNEFHALKDVDIQVAPGELVAVVGRSGAGKSTLLHILSGIDRGDDGEYWADGQCVNGMSEKELAVFRNRQIGMVMQDFALIDGYSVEENVMVPLVFGRVRGRRERRRRVQEVLEQVGIADLAAKKVSQLSGGQKQRVAIARAIVHHPPIILADEPTGALDSVTSESILGVFSQLRNEGKTVLLVTHDSKVSASCERVIEIADGRVCERAGGRMG